MNEELASSLRDGREVQGIGGSTNCSFHSNSLSNKIAIDKLAKLIYILIVVGIGKDRIADRTLLERRIGKDRAADRRNLSHEAMEISYSFIKSLLKLKSE